MSLENGTKVVVLRTCWLGAEVVREGEIITVSTSTAFRLEALGAVSRKLPDAAPIAEAAETKTTNKRATKP
jgi:hypothetical protein